MVIKTQRIHEHIHAMEVMTLNCTKLFFDPKELFDDGGTSRQSNFTQYNAKRYSRRDIHDDGSLIIGRFTLIIYDDWLTTE